MTYYSWYKETGHLKNLALPTMVQSRCRFTVWNWQSRNPGNSTNNIWLSAYMVDGLSNLNKRAQAHQLILPLVTDVHHPSSHRSLPFEKVQQRSNTMTRSLA